MAILKRWVRSDTGLFQAFGTRARHQHQPTRNFRSWSKRLARSSNAGTQVACSYGRNRSNVRLYGPSAMCRDSIAFLRGSGLSLAPMPDTFVSLVITSNDHRAVDSLSPTFTNTTPAVAYHSRFRHEHEVRVLKVAARRCSWGQARRPFFAGDHVDIEWTRRG